MKYEGIEYYPEQFSAIGQKWKKEPDERIYSVDFEGYQITGLDEEKPKNSEIELVLSGYVKWDGCMNFEAGSRCKVHVCNTKMLEQYAWLLGKIYVECLKTMGEKPE